MSWRSTENGDYPAEGAIVIAYNGEEAYVSRYSTDVFRSAEHGFEVSPTIHWSPRPEAVAQNARQSEENTAPVFAALFHGIRLQGYDLEASNDVDAVYYRPIYCHRSGGFVAVCLQWFDEYDYSQSNFLNHQRYGREEDCKRVCDAANLLLGDLPKRMDAHRLYSTLKYKLSELGVLRKEDEADENAD